MKDVRGVAGTRLEGQIDGQTDRRTQGRTRVISIASICLRWVTKMQDNHQTLQTLTELLLVCVCKIYLHLFVPIYRIIMIEYLFFTFPDEGDPAHYVF